MQVVKQYRNYPQKKHTAPGIRWSSPTQLLVWRLVTYLWESGRDPEFYTIYGRMYTLLPQAIPITLWVGVNPFSLSKGVANGVYFGV
jgi:hypothetical protein